MNNFPTIWKSSSFFCLICKSTFSEFSSKFITILSNTSSNIWCNLTVHIIIAWNFLEDFLTAFNCFFFNKPRHSCTQSLIYIIIWWPISSWNACKIVNFICYWEVWNHFISNWHYYWVWTLESYRYICGFTSFSCCI